MVYKNLQWEWPYKQRPKLTNHIIVLSLKIGEMSFILILKLINLY